jgi:hypothetical protein
MAKLAVGMEMLGEARIGEFDTVHSTLQKVLGNIVASPDEPKFRKLRTSNAKISALLATRGVRAILIGSGFIEEGEMLVLPETATAEGAEAALAALAAQAVDRSAAESSRKMADQAARKEHNDKENEERKRMKAGISDDAAARKEPGWTAKAAGVKDGKAITGCSDIGVGKDCGG